MVELMGVELTPRVREWHDDQRRVGSIVALGAAVLVVLAGLVAWYALDVTAAGLYYGLVAALALVLVFEVLVHVLRPRDIAPAPVASSSEPGHAPARAARTLTLRCGDCSTVFDLTDIGERPLYHTCPGCGAEGVLRDPPPAQPQAAAPEAFAPPATAAAAPSAVKRLKLRCGGCKEVFSIEDTGERPLRRPCPYCARMGEVR